MCFVCTFARRCVWMDIFTTELGTGPDVCVIGCYLHLRVLEGENGDLPGVKVCAFVVFKHNMSFSLLTPPPPLTSLSFFLPHPTPHAFNSKKQDQKQTQPQCLNSALHTCNLPVIVLYSSRLPMLSGSGHSSSRWNLCRPCVKWGHRRKIENTQEMALCVEARRWWSCLTLDQSKIPGGLNTAR